MRIGENSEGKVNRAARLVGGIDEQRQGRLHAGMSGPRKGLVGIPRAFDHNDVGAQFVKRLPQAAGTTRTVVPNPGMV